jgi:hypothetical protein
MENKMTEMETNEGREREAAASSKGEREGASADGQKAKVEYVCVSRVAKQITKAKYILRNIHLV